MAGNFDPKVSVLQTATQASASLISSLTEAGVIEDAAQALEQFMNFRDDIVKELDERAAASPAPTYGGGWAKKEAKPAFTGNPGDFKFESGKKAGKTIAEVHADDPSYLEWLTEKSTGNSMKEAKTQAQAFLDATKAGV